MLYLAPELSRREGTCAISGTSSPTTGRSNNKLQEQQKKQQAARERETANDRNREVSRSWPSNFQFFYREICFGEHVTRLHHKNNRCLKPRAQVQNRLVLVKNDSSTLEWHFEVLA